MQQPAPSEVNSPARKVQGMINLMEAAGHVRHQDWSSRGPTQIIMPLRVRRTSARVAWQRGTARASPRLEAGPSGEMKFVNRERLSHFQEQKPNVRYGSIADVRRGVSSRCARTAAMGGKRSLERGNRRLKALTSSP